MLSLLYMLEKLAYQVIYIYIYTQVHVFEMC